MLTQVSSLKAVKSQGRLTRDAERQLARARARRDRLIAQVVLRGVATEREAAVAAGVSPAAAHKAVVRFRPVDQ